MMILSFAQKVCLAFMVSQFVMFHIALYKEKVGESLAHLIAATVFFLGVFL